jgi:hypothetical protein
MHGQQKIKYLALTDKQNDMSILAKKLKRATFLKHRIFS